jgi:hypothetical protein
LRSARCFAYICCGCRDDVRRRFKLAEIPLDSLLGVQTDFACVRAQKAAEEDTVWQLLDLVLLDVAKDADADLCRVRDLIKREASPIARLPQDRADVHSIEPRRRWKPTAGGRDLHVRSLEQ